MQGQEAFPDAHGEVAICTRTTTSMPGRAHPAKEGLRVEARAQGSHKLLWGREPCSSTSTSPLSHTALPYPSATSLGADGPGQPCPERDNACCVQLAGSQGLTSARTPVVQPGTAHQVISHPKAWESRDTQTGAHLHLGVPAPLRARGAGLGSKLALVKDWLLLMNRPKLNLPYGDNYHTETSYQTRRSC